MMRNLSIAYGNSRQAKKWSNKTVKFDDLKERLKTTMRTTESAEEYAKMNKSQRDTDKEHGGFVAGTLKGGRRKVETVEKRSMITLDGERITKEFLADYENRICYTSVLYTTHSSTLENPRVRILVPLTRDVTPEEFVAISRYLAQNLGIDYFDECSYQPNQLMYWPSTPSNGVFVYIDGKNVTFKASAAIPRIYRNRFHRDIYKDLHDLQKSIDQEASALDTFSLELFEDISYIMAKHADPAGVPDTSDEWLDQFGTFSIYQVLPEIIELWGLNVQTQVESKKTSTD